ncbi:coiled-coil domain-containing protein 190 [Varanus komodoensis]|uniref:coiled-coil domain-containing protein 190 n=1 Tax=Varanus komodoensis TaxID=61221 RepID=UPI001CF7C70F|nr:coiled-coil domain-containing protein 190 [Varanus komodoensis]
MAEGEPSRRWEAKRRDARRAEARLSHGLRSLEEAQLSYLNSLVKEQKRLEEELQKLRRTQSRKERFVGPGHPSEGRALPSLPPQARRDASSSQGAALRSRRRALSGAEGLPRAGWLSLDLQAHNSDVLGCAEGREGLWPPLEAEDQSTAGDTGMASLKHSVARQLSISAEPVPETESDCTEEGGRGPPREDPEDAPASTPRIATRFVNLPEKQSPSHGHERPIMDPEAYAADGRLRTMYSRPNFLKLYAEVRKARYLRHKSVPAWEKELSLQDIFGHNTTKLSPAEHAAPKPKP